jgi:NADPH:quinone reductase-like Zn-dependent oxidoreductase
VRGISANAVGDITERLRTIRPDGVDALIDLTRDPARFISYSSLVRDGGTASTTTFTASPELLASERISVCNYEMRNKPDLLARITTEVASGRIEVPVQRTVTFEETPVAPAGNIAGGTGGARGKTTIRIR